MPAAEAATVAREGDALRFTGPLVRDAVPALWRAALPLLPGAAQLQLAGVTRVDSAGVALLAELAQRAAVSEVHGVPPGLAELRAAYRLSAKLAFAQ